MDRRGKVGPGSRRATWLRVTATASSAALIGLLGLPGTALAAANARHPGRSPGQPATPAADSSSCHLGNGVKHVVQLTFDNVHFFRDNPNVPSDLEQLPNLLNFFEDNGTFLSNNHTPLIAHTADDILTTYTGLYGDRQGMPMSNDYQAYNKNGPDGTYGTTDSASSFTYWTDPIDDTTSPPTPGARHQPEHGLLAGAAGHLAHPGHAEHHHPRPLGPLHPGRLRRGRRRHRQPGAGEHHPGHRRRVRRQLARGPAAGRRPGLVQGPGDRGLRRRGRALRPGQRVLRRRPGGQVRPDHAVTHRGRRTCCPTSRAATTASRPCSATSTSRRSSARARPA